MYDMYEVLIVCILSILVSAALTPFVRKLAFKVGAVDVPSKRRVNEKVMPSMGGLAIYATYFFALIFFQPVSWRISVPIFIAATIVIVTGIIDDIKEISPKAKVLGLSIATIFIIYQNNLTIGLVTLPFLGQIDLGIWGYPVTFLWVLGITNALNLIDGLDGLASGVSIIALSTMGIVSFFFLEYINVVTTILIFTLVGSIAGFWPYNFFPAKIYLGDTGALFLGFMISVLSLYGLKNVTFITLIIPIVILGIPITDTVYAILRRYLNKMPISSADKHHMHHRLMSLGLSHKQTVLVIYLIAIIFSVIALLYPISSFLGSVLITIALLLGLEVFVELIGLVGEDRRPLLNRLHELGEKLNQRK